ncbi:GNAT family N-acetyltransferase, partial [Leucobacter massiliensis]
MDEWVIRELTAEETRDAGFRRLLWLAAEVDDRELDRIVAAELPRLTALGAFDGGRLLGFVAFDAGSDPVTVEYIAAAEAAQGRGIGRVALIHMALIHIRRCRRNAVVPAHTHSDVRGAQSKKKKRGVGAASRVSPPITTVEIFFFFKTAAPPANP